MRRTAAIVTATVAVSCAFGSAYATGGEATSKAMAKAKAAAKRVRIVSDALVGPGVTLSAGYDTTSYKLIETRFQLKQEDSPGLLKDWTDCQQNGNAGAENCGRGQANVFYSTEGGVPAGGGIIGDGIWMVQIRAQPQAPGQHWRARIHLVIEPK